MSHSTLRSYTKNFRTRSLSAPESVASQVVAMKQERLALSDRREIKARKKLILEAASRGLTFHPIDNNSDIKASAEVGQELRNISELIEKRYVEDRDEFQLTYWVNDLIAKLIAPYERYHVHQWIQEQGGWNGVLKLARNKYQAIVECVPRYRRMGWWRQIAVAAGVVTISVVAVGAGIWYFR